MAGMAPKAPPEELEDDEEIPNVGEDEQQEYEEFVLAAMALTYEGKQVRPSILKMLDEDPSDLMAVLGETEALEQFSPIVAIAATAVMIVMQIISMVGDERPSDDVIFQGGKEIVQDLVQISTKMGNKIGQDEANRAFLMAADLYREVAADAGMIDEEALKAQFNELTTADKEGRLGEILPELDKVNQAVAMNDADGEPEEEVV